MQPSQKVEQLAFSASAYILFIMLTVKRNCSSEMRPSSSAGNRVWKNIVTIDYFALRVAFLYDLYTY